MRRLILDTLDEVSTLEDPRTRRKALTSTWGGFWRYRVGNYRIICEIHDSELRILAVKVAHHFPHAQEARLARCL